MTRALLNIITDVGQLPSARVPYEEMLISGGSSVLNILLFSEEPKIKTVFTLETTTQFYSTLPS